MNAPVRDRVGTYEAGSGDAIPLGDPPGLREVFSRALAAIRSVEPRYVRAGRVTASHPDYKPAEAICVRTLARALADKRFLRVPVRTAFFSWARAHAERSRLVSVLAAYDHLARGDVRGARAFAEHAVHCNQDDLYAQTLYRRCHPELPPEPDLKDRFCSHPFERLETQSRGRVFFCCPAWLPVPIGDLNAGSPDEVWNSQAAEDIRASILDGSYRYCSKMHCPRLTANNLPHVNNVRDPDHRETLDSGRTSLAKPPRRIALSHDRSCNLSCPSCRNELIMARKAEMERMTRQFEATILPMMDRVRKIQLTGSGDPFASSHYRAVIRRLAGRDRPPGLRLALQTNGLLLKDSWDELGIGDSVEELLISIDAARAETYAVLRRGGDFARLLDNLAFVSGLRRAGRVGRVRLDFVVQALNFREMPAAVDLMREHGFDGLKFQMIRSWDTYSPTEFARHDIGSPHHGEHGAFLSVLRDPRLAGADVEYYGFHSIDAGTIRHLRHGTELAD